VHFRRLLILSALFALASPLGAQTIEASKVLKGVEERYNKIDRLRANFTQTHRVQGRTKAAQKGVLQLSKPGKTRWEYSNPAGRIFISDGKQTFDYDPEDKTLMVEPMKETDDSRVPLSFLIGKLDFDKYFKEYRSKPEGADAFITAKPKNDKLAFTEISMLIAPDSTIKKVIVVGADYSTMEYLLENEQRNIPVPDSLFKFTPPAGTKVVTRNK
jgi:outer membrane lipoprotein carrier protein